MPDWLDVIVRSLFFLTVLFLITKWLGKKQISQLSFFEYVTGITIGSIGAGVAMNSKESLFHGVLSIFTFTFVPFIAVRISLKSKAFRDFVEGKASVFIKDGQIIEANLKKEKYTADELLELLRKKNVFNVSDVEFAILEATGDLNVLLKKENQPLTSKDLNLAVDPIKEPQIVIMDGKVMEEPLSMIGKDQNWLKSEMEARGVSIHDVFLGQVASNGDLSVDLYDDKLPNHSSQEESIIFATLKKCQADLGLFAVETKKPELQKLYMRNSENLLKAINQAASFFEK